MSLPALTPGIIEVIKSNSRKLPDEGYYDLLVSMAGYSPQTTAQAYLILKPKNLCIITSSSSGDVLEAITYEIACGLGLEAPEELDKSTFSLIICEPTDPLDIYHKIYSQIKAIKNKGNNNHLKICIDITGGKKVMSAAAALAAWQLDMDIIYSENAKYNDRERGPSNLEDMKIIKLSNPVTIFGDLEENEINKLFNNGLFSAASDAYKKLWSRMDEKYAEDRISQLKVKYYLSNLYNAWCNIDLFGIAKAIDKIYDNFKLFQYNLVIGDYIKLQHQLSFLKNLVLKRTNNPIDCINFYLLGQHYISNHFDFAVLLFYRCIENIFKSILEFNYKNFKFDNPNFNLLFNEDIKNIKSLTKKFNETSLKLLKWETKKLPSKLTFMNSAILLYILDKDFIDEVIQESGSKEGINYGEDKYSKFFTSLKETADLRNYSILAHGNSNLNEFDCSLLRAKSGILLKLYLYKIKFNDLNFDRYQKNEFNKFLERYQFIKFRDNIHFRTK
jgi:hypothetical protein